MYLILVFLTLVLGLAERRVTFICLCYMRVYIACSYCVFVLHVRSKLILAMEVCTWYCVAWCTCIDMYLLTPVLHQSHQE